MTYDIICHMKRTTIFLPESLERQLRMAAKRQEKPVAALVREALTKHLESLPSPAPFKMPRTFDTGRSDISERIDELAFKDFKIHGDEPPLTRGSE